MKVDIKSKLVFNKEQWAQLARMQDEQNNFMLGSNWITHENNTMPYYRAAVVEIGEALELYGFKWWKNPEFDLNGFKMKLIDILHYAVSDKLRRYARIFDIMEDGTGTLYDNFGRYMEDTILPRGELYSVMPNVGSFARNGQVKDPSPLDYLDFLTYRTMLNGEVDLEMVLLCCNSINMTAEETYNLYVSKFCLNKFRKDNGFKGEGSLYVKEWYGTSDVKYLTGYVTTCISHDKPISEDTISTFLKLTYNNVKENLDKREAIC